MRSQNVGKDVDRPNHISRATIAVSPLLLILGIVAQAILLVMVCLLFVPCMIWPGILDGPYQWITKGMGRIMVRTIFPKKTRNGSGTVTISLSNRPGLGASGPGRLPLQWKDRHNSGGTKWTSPEW